MYGGAPSRHLEWIAGSLIERLQASYRCLYLNNPAMVAGMRSQLAAAGVDVPAAIDRGALILSSDQGHLVDGIFDIGRMLDLLRQAVKQALADGYAGLWASGDMTWEMGGEGNLDKLAEYERRLHGFMRDNSCLAGVCMYHRDTLPPHAIQTALATHPALYVCENLWRLNSLFQSSQAVEA